MNECSILKQAKKRGGKKSGGKRLTSADAQLLHRLVNFIAALLANEKVDLVELLLGLRLLLLISRHLGRTVAVQAAIPTAAVVRFK